MWARLLGILSLTAIATVMTGPSSFAQEAAPAAPDEIATAPVIVEGTTLFRVRGVSSFSADERARGIIQRITDIASDRSVPIESLRTRDEADRTLIIAGDRPVMTVIDADASLEQVARAQLGEIHLVRIRQAIVDYRTARAAPALRRAAMMSGAATLVLAIAIAALWWLWRQLDPFVKRRLESRIRRVGIQSFEVVRAEQIAAGLRSALLMVRTIVILTALLLYVGFVLAQWPSTRDISRNMAGFAVAPLQVMFGGLVASMPSVVFLVVLFFIVRVLLRVIRLFFEAIDRGSVVLNDFDRDWAQPTYKLVRLGIVAFALIVAYPYIPGSDSAAFKGVSVFLGIVFSLGSSTAISNIIAGYMMTYRRAFHVGDRVQIGDAVGEVTNIRLQVTHLRTAKNEELIIPNSEILSGHIVNYSSLAQTRGLILHTEVGIGYETPWRQVEAMLLESAERTPGLATEPPPFVLEKKLGDFAITYELNVYCNNVQGIPRLYAALHRNILDVFNEYGIQIMTPAYEGDPEQPKVVSRDDWFTSPARRPAATSEKDPSLVS